MERDVDRRSAEEGVKDLSISGESAELRLPSSMGRDRSPSRPPEAWSVTAATLPMPTTSNESGFDCSARQEEDTKMSTDRDNVQTLSTHKVDASATFGKASPFASSSVRCPPSSDAALPTSLFRSPDKPRTPSAAPSDETVVQEVQYWNPHFANPLESKYKCTICQKLLCNPVQTDCGHRFCSSCIEQVRRKQNPTCPLDKEPVCSVNCDNSCKKEILLLPVNCQNGFAGCTWKGKLKDLNDHLVRCHYIVIPCPNGFLGCSSKLQRLNLLEHLEEKCAFREVSCPQCREKMPFNALEGHMEETCTTFNQTEVPCPNQCGASVKRLNMSDHLHKQCKNSVETCLYIDKGCSFKGISLEMADHLESSTAHHLELVNQYTAELTEKHARTEQSVVVLREQVQLLTERLARLEPSVHKQICVPQATPAVAKSASHEHVLAVEKKVNHTCQVTEINKARINNLERDVNKMCERTSDIMAEFDHQLLSEESTDYNGITVWKIPDYQRKFEEARTGEKVSLYSQPFFTSREGYKMCARVYLNGDGIGKGTHFSLFFILMKGKHDALLPWPFHQKVTLALLDQSPLKQHVSDVFMPNKDSPSFQRPMSEMNKASGCQRFASLDMLQQGPCSYIKDDMVAVGIAVDKAGLAS